MRHRSDTGGGQREQRPFATKQHFRWFCGPLGVYDIWWNYYRTSGRDLHRGILDSPNAELDSATQDHQALRRGMPVVRQRAAGREAEHKGISTALSMIAIGR
jgi:hypothetical protein